MKDHARIDLSRVVGLLICVLAPSCAGQPPDVSSPAEPPAMAVAVGPIPGPVKTAEEKPNPFATDRSAAGQGRKLFVQFNCSGCHGGRAGGGMGPSLRDVDWMYGSSEAQIFSTIAQGRAHGMPSWQSKLTNTQIWMLVAYIKSLRTRMEPQPPTS
ncbi:MAG TPA: c-type cytochrome [Vicinamibacterales bacterium]|nr:c-type cytochrome [Vicinamibacterales bacterium]